MQRKKRRKLCLVSIRIRVGENVFMEREKDGYCRDSGWLMMTIEKILPQLEHPQTVVRWKKVQ